MNDMARWKNFSVNKALQYFLAFAIVAFTGWLIWLFVKNIGAADASIKAGLIGLFGMLTAALITHYQSKKREIDARHFADKRKGYLHMIDLLFDIIMATKTGRELSEEELIKEMMSFKKALIIWGSPDIIQTWNEYEISASDQIEPKEMIRHMERVLREIRKDLGHDDKSLKFGSLWGLMLIAEDKKIALGDD
jgi:hypothetical protein